MSLILYQHCISTVTWNIYPFLDVPSWNKFKDVASKSDAGCSQPLTNPLLTKVLSVCYNWLLILSTVFSSLSNKNQRLPSKWKSICRLSNDVFVVDLEPIRGQSHAYFYCEQLWKSTLLHFSVFQRIRYLFLVLTCNCKSTRDELPLNLTKRSMSLIYIFKVRYSKSYCNYSKTT